MSHFSKVSPSGRVTLPQAVREHLGVSTGDWVEFVFDGECTIIRPLRREANPFQKYAGVLGRFRNKQEINAWLDGLRSDERHS